MYVPYYESTNCAYVYDANWIRVYESRPTSNSTINYVEYNYNSHYLSRTGSTTFSTYSTLPTCRNDVTTNFYQRTDICEILIIFTIFVGFNWFLISKLVKTLLRGGRVS